LRPTYGLDEFLLQQQTKQQEGEEARVYLSKLKTNLRLIGYSDSPVGARHLLTIFVNGLLPDIRRTVKSLKPQTIEMALSIAREASINSASRGNKRGTHLMNHLDNLSSSYVSSSPQPKNKIQAVPQRTSKQSTNDKIRMKSHCVGCNTSGHTYRQCRKLNDTQKQRKRYELQKLYREAEKKGSN
jgi:hypothetical protein